MRLRPISGRRAGLSVTVARTWVITGNRVPDQATVARFIARHEAALSDLFAAVLGLCDRAGLVASGIVAIDGTKFHANASRDANVDYDQIAREVIADAIATDQAQDELYGDRRGDELPEELQTRGWSTGVAGPRISARSRRSG
jgi:hypothetical protein